MARTFTSSLTVELIDRVTGVSRRVSSAMERMGGSITDVTSPRTRLDAAMARNEAALGNVRGKLIDAAAGAMTLYGGFKTTLGAAMSLEDKMADIGKVTDMNEAQLKGFEGALRNLSRSEIPMAVEELAELAASAAASGIADNDLEAFTRQVAKSAVAWGVSGGYAGEALAKIKSALGMTIDETSRYADAINYLADTSASEAPDLIEFARRVAADGKIAGFSNEQVLALGSSMISMGAEADVAATSLRNAQKALTRGTSATKRQDAAFRKLGLEAEDVAKAMPNDAMGQFLMVLGKINQLDQHERISTMSDLFGDEARALMLLLGNLDDVRMTTAAVADETNYLGSVQKEFEIRSKTGRYALQRFNNQLRDVGISIGSSLLPAMKQVLETLSPILLAIGDWAAQNPNLVASIAAVTAGLVALRVGMIALRFVALSALNPLLRIGSAILTVAGAGARLWGAGRAMVALHTALAAMGGSTLTGLQRVMLWVRGMAGAVPGLSRVAGVIGRIGSALGRLVLAIPGVGHLARAFAPVGTAIAGVLRSIGLIGPAMTRAASTTEAATARMSAAISRIKFGGLMAGLSMLNLASSMPSTPEGLAKSRDAGDKAMDEGLRKTPVIGPLMRGYEGAYRWVHGEDAPGASPDPDGARAKGGRVSQGGDYLVGEEGPEVITARRSGYVHPNDALEADGQRPARAPAKAREVRIGTVNITPSLSFPNATMQDAQAIARRVMDLIERETAFALRGAFADIEPE